MAAPETYISFLVRMWREESLEMPEPTGDWRGEVEHVQSGRRWTFDTLDKLLCFVRRLAEDPEACSSSAHK